MSQKWVKKVMHGHIVRNRSRGRQPKTWLDNIKKVMITYEWNMREAVDMAGDRSNWWRLATTSSSAIR